MNRARERAVAQTQGELRRIGEETLAVRHLYQQAFEHFLAARVWTALRGYLKVAWLVPSLLTSPLTRPMVLRPMSRCLVGPWGVRLGRVLLPRIQRLLRRDVDFSVRKAGPEARAPDRTESEDGS